VGTVLVDRAGNLWVGNGEVLSLLHRETGKFEHFALDHPFMPHSLAPPIFTMYEDKECILWLGTTNGILSFDPKTHEIKHYPHHPTNTEGISDYWVFAIREDNRGNLWAGTGSNALNRLDRKTGTFTHYKYDPHKSGSISTNGVMSIYEDSQGNLWFGTIGGGLCSFDYATETFKAFTEKQGLPDNSIYAILEDNQGHLWLDTNKGYCRFSIANKTCTNYDSDHILQSNPFTAGLKGKDGTFYFGGRGGFTLFHPEAIQANPYVPPVVITQFKVFEKPLPGKQEAQEIELDHSQNFFTFEFAALSFTSPGKNQYAYQLKGVDQDWVKAGMRRSASYTNIDPGEYTFQVKGSNNDGIWNTTPTTIRIVIHPPFWRTDWFKFALILFSALLLYIFYQVRIRAIKAHNQLLEGMVQERTEELNLRSHQLELSLQETQRQQREAEYQRQRAEEANRVKTELTNITVHDLKNPLGTILLYTRLVMGAATDPDKVRSLTGVIGETAQTMFQLLTNLLKKSKLENTTISIHKERIDLSLLVRAAVERNQAQAAQKQQHLILQRDGCNKVEADAELLNEVLDNLISNAIKFTGKEKKIWVGTESTEAVVKVWVKDEGAGLYPEEMGKLFQPFQRLSALPTDGENSTGLGLSIVKRIVELHGGAIEAESEGPCRGSTFTVVMPAVDQTVMA
jgi:signal transduction histidine kinase